MLLKRPCFDLTPGPPLRRRGGEQPLPIGEGQGWGASREVFIMKRRISVNRKMTEKEAAIYFFRVVAPQPSRAPPNLARRRLKGEDRNCLLEMAGLSGQNCGGRGKFFSGGAALLGNLIELVNGLIHLLHPDILLAAGGADFLH